MVNRSADEGPNRPSRDPLRRAAEQGPVRGTDASERAADMAADKDAPLAPGADEGRTPRGIPPVIPAGAAANMAVDSTGGASGSQTGPQGAPAAAAMIAGQIAFGQKDVKSGWDVFAADDVKFGTVAEVGPERILVSRIDRGGQVYIPYSAVASVDKSQVHLTVPSAMVDQQDWQQVRPGGPSGGIAPPGSDSGMGTPHRGSGPGTSVGEGEAASHAAVPESAEHAGPVTTGRGVEEGPTVQPIRSDPPQSHLSAADSRPEPASRPAGPPMPPQYSEGVESMQQAHDMMSNVRNTVQGAAQGRMSESAPKDAFADMLAFLENVPNSFYYLGTVIAVMSSLVLFVSGKRWESLFVGLWAPTIISASMFYKLLRPSHEVRQM